MDNLINIFKYLIWIVLIPVTFLLADGVYVVPYFNENPKLDQDKDVVIIYDNFLPQWDHGPTFYTHGDMMVEIFQKLKLTNEEDYSLLKIDYRLFPISELKNIINKIKNNHKLFINISFTPNIKRGQKDFADIISELSKDDNITITQAIGNWNNYKDINLTIENEINKRIKIRAIKELALTHREIDLNMDGNFSKYWALKFTENRAGVESLVENVINPILSRYSIVDKVRERIIDGYTENLLEFSYSALLQSKESKVIIVSAYTPFKKKNLKNSNKSFKDIYYEYRDMNFTISNMSQEQLDNNLSQDCGIKGLVSNKVRNLGQFIDKNGVPHNGTSAAAPIELAERFNKYIKSKGAKK